MPVTAPVSRECERYLNQFAQFEAGRRDGEWLRSLRRAAIARFADLGFPTPRQEAWRFTNLAPLVDVAFLLAEPASADERRIPASLRQPFGDWPCPTMVFVNGWFSPVLSSLDGLPPGVVVCRLAEVLQESPHRVEPFLARVATDETHPFVALNTAFLADGAFVYLPKGVVVDEPIHLLFLSTAGEHPSVAHPRTLIVAHAQSEATIVETYCGEPGAVSFTNAVTEIVLGANARLSHYQVQRESLAGFFLSSLAVREDRDATFTDSQVSLGAALSRTDLTVVLDGEGSECTLQGFYLATGRQHVDYHTLIEHVKPHSTSREVYKGILDGQATGVFNGRIIVRPGAQKTDARQTNKNLILSEEALVNSNPQLEIYADDVKCTHGSAIGQLDADALFYLRTRGIEEDAARQILTYAFASDILGRITVEPIRRMLEARLVTYGPHSQQKEEGV